MRTSGSQLQTNSRRGRRSGRSNAELTPKWTGEAIAQALRQEIIRGEIDPGTWLRERDLGRRFGVSRGPVRSALATLAELGLVETLRFRGAQVRSLSMFEIDDLFEIRAALLGLLAKLVCLRAPQSAVEAILEQADALIAQAGAGVESARIVAMSGEIARLMALHTGSREVQALVLDAMKRSAWHVRYHQVDLDQADRRAVLIANWRKLCTAIRERKPETAARCARNVVYSVRPDSVKAVIQRSKPAPQAQTAIAERAP